MQFQRTAFTIELYSSLLLSPAKIAMILKQILYIAAKAFSFSFSLFDSRTIRMFRMIASFLFSFRVANFIFDLLFWRFAKLRKLFFVASTNSTDNQNLA